MSREKQPPRELYRHVLTDNTGQGLYADMHTGHFLQDLAIVMIVAGVVTIIFHRLKQPVVLGYILAGLIIGPHTPPFPLVRDLHNIETLSGIGVILLMFSLGLHFSLSK